MKKDLRNELIECIAKATSLKANYKTTMQQEANGEIIVFNGTNTMMVNYENKTGKTISEEISPFNSVTIESIYKKNCKYTTTTSTDRTTGSSASSSMPMVYLPFKYEQEFEIGGMLYPFNLTNLIPVGCGDSEDCQKYTQKPESVKCIAGYLNSTIKICKISQREFTIECIVNFRDCTSGVVTTNTMNVNIKLCYEN